MIRVQWFECWDELRERIQNTKTSWGRNELLELMIDIERRKVRAAEKFVEDTVYSQPVNLENFKP